LSFQIQPLLETPSSSASWPALPFLIYGAGNKGKEVYRFLVNAGHRVDGFLDTHANPGQCCHGIPVHTPEDWLLRKGGLDYCVVVAIHNYSVDMPPLLEKIQRLGFCNLMNIVEFYNHFPGALPNHYWLASRSYYEPFGGEIEALSRLFTDSTSQHWLNSVLEFRLSGNYQALPPPQFGDQYRPDDLPRWPERLRLIDCGAFDGDTLSHLAEAGYHFEAIAAFEPDMLNFQRLTRRVSQFEQAICFPCGVGAATGQLRFNSEQGMASHVSSTGDTVIQCVSLDDALVHFQPNLIKMDIEGAEIDALWGARKMIANSRPGLAISLYHHPAHLWQIPLLIASWKLGYRFYIRGHAYNTYDLVLYAIPD